MAEPTGRPRGRPARVAIGAEPTGANGHAEFVASEPLAVNGQTVDAAQLDLEAARIKAEAAAQEAAAAAALPPTPEAQAAAQQVENAEEGYKMLAYAVVAQGSDLFVPNWKVTAVEITDLSDAIVQALMIWFPDGVLPPKYMALLVVAAVGGKIALARRDPSGAMLPRHAPAQQPATNSSTADPYSYAH